jgi:hypothetical protein
VTASAPLTGSADHASAKPAAEPLSASSNDEVLKAVHEWISAWSSKNANKYLAMYAKNFKTPDNEARSNWEQQRRERISKPQAIVVSISNVSFIQSYRSGPLKSTTRKTLEMIRSNGKWQILSEQTGNK